MSDNFLPLLADRVLNVPLFLHPSKAETIYAAIEGRINLGPLGPPPADASRFVGTSRREDGTSRNFTRAAGKTALITVDGSLVNRGAWVGAYSGLTSYEGIKAQVDEAVADAGIENIVFDINSLGGEATGMFGLTAAIRNARKTKRVIAVVNDQAASAGYGIASSADEIWISPTSLVGSIGVVMMHMDRSGEFAAKGVRPTLIHAGAHKVDGHPFGPLPESVRADMQRDVLAFYDRFLEVVEAGRGKARLSAKKARETEARVFMGQDAITAGLADRVGSLDEALAELSRSGTKLSGKSSTRTNLKMTTTNDDAPAAGITPEKYAADIAAARADERRKVEAEIAAKAAANANPPPAAEDPKARIAAILDCDEAKGREAQAKHIALNTDMSVDAAKGLLATMPKAGGVQTIEQRSQEAGEIGATGKDASTVSAEQVKAGWARAFAR